MNDPVLRRWRDRTILRILLIPVMVLVPLVVLGCLILFAGATGFIFEGSDTGLWVFVGGIACLGGTAVFGGLGVVLYLRRGSHRVYNDIFEGVGLLGSGYLFSGRKYQGSYGGRQFNVYVYTSGYRYNRRPVMELYVEAPVGARMGIGTKNVLANVAAGVLNKDALEGTGLDGDVAVYADDKSWARGMLDAPGVRQTVQKLMEPAGKYELRVINYMPDSIRLQITSYPRGVVTQDNVSRMFDELLSLVGALDEAPRPNEIVKASQTEINARTNRAAFTRIACGIVAAIALGSVGVIACVLLFVLMFEGAA